MEREPPHGLEALDLLSPELPLVGGVTYGLHAVAGSRPCPIPAAPANTPPCCLPLRRGHSYALITSLVRL